MKGSAGRPARPIDENAPYGEFAQHLRELRGAANLTLRELSRRIGYSTGWLSEAENGEKLPSLAVTLAFVGACGADPQAWAAQWRKAAGSLNHTPPQTRRAGHESGPTQDNAALPAHPIASFPPGQVAGEHEGEQDQAQHEQARTRHDNAEGHAKRVQGSIDVALVDDHPIILESAASWIMADGSDIRLVATAATVGALLAGPGRRADVVLIDLDLGDGTTVDGNVAAILAAGPAVLILSASDRPVAVRAAMRAGARGYVLKNEQSPQIRSAIREVAAGRDWISPRLAYIFATDDTADRPALSQQEGRALQLYATGMALKSVARKMAISEDTAKQYLGRVREKYANAGRAAPTKLELYYRAVEDGYLPPPP